MPFVEGFGHAFYVWTTINEFSTGLEAQTGFPIRYRPFSGVLVRFRFVFVLSRRTKGQTVCRFCTESFRTWLSANSLVQVDQRMLKECTVLLQAASNSQQQQPVLGP
eukprot:scaffold1434_cov107-Cylindrotheca_fusiformis.AAC.5